MSKPKTMPNPPIKLLNIGEHAGVTRLQSQPAVGKRIADFVLRDGKLEVWNGGDFVPTDIPYEIFTTIEYQAL